MRNYWVTTKRESFAHWLITLPPVNTNTTESLLRFTHEVLDAGERENVYRILQINGIKPFHGTLNYSYLDYLIGEMNETGILAPFSVSGGAAPSEGGQNRIFGRVCYYDLADRVLEEDVEDIGLLLQQLRPEKVNGSMGYMSRVPVLVISGLSSVNVKEKPLDEPMYFSIKLNTDIWFPRVAGFLEDVNLPSDLSEMFDNSELASRHTPRLNRFLNSVYKLVQDLGGKWEFVKPEGEGRLYETMCNLHGIELNLNK